MSKRIFSRGLAAVLSVMTAGGTSVATELQLTAQGGGTARSGDNDGRSSLGPVLGVTPLIRLSQPLAIGLLVEYSRMDWANAFPGSGATAVSNLLVAGVGRWYPAGDRPVAPYLQLGAGQGFHSKLPSHPTCSLKLGPTVHLALGLDVGLGVTTRLGALVAGSTPVYTLDCIGVQTSAAPPSPGVAMSAQASFTSFWDAAD